MSDDQYRVSRLLETSEELQVELNNRIVSGWRAELVRDTAEKLSQAALNLASLVEEMEKKGHPPRVSYEDRVHE